jgi:hypothetical protein
MKPAEIRQAVKDTVKANDFPDTRIRITVSIGEGTITPNLGSCIEPTIAVLVTEYHPPAPEKWTKWRQPGRISRKEKLRFLPGSGCGPVPGQVQKNKALIIHPVQALAQQFLDKDKEKGVGNRDLQASLIMTEPIFTDKCVMSTRAAQIGTEFMEANGIKPYFLCSLLAVYLSQFLPLNLPLLI